MDPVIISPSTPGATFTSKEQARDWVLELAVGVREMRALVDVQQVPGEQRRLYHKMLLRYGSAKGALDALYRTGYVEDTFYKTVSDQLIVAIATRLGG